MSVTCEIESGSSSPQLYYAIPVEVAECTVPSDKGMVLSLVEMTDMEYMHLQPTIYSQMEAQSEENVPGDAASSPPAIHTVYTSADPAKTPSPTVGQSNTPPPESQYLSTSSDQQSNFQEIKGILMCDPDHLPDRTPTTYGESPEPVLARAAEMRPNPPVHLESRFTCSPRQQESRHDQPTPLNSVLSKLHHPAEILAAAIQSQSSRCLKLGGAKSTVSRPVEFPYPALYGSNMRNSMVGLSQSQGIGSISHMLEAAKDQDLIIPRNFSFSYQHDAGPAKSALCYENEQAVEPKISIKTEQRRERHNAIKRDRRQRIRICCDELNKLVPFCQRDTDTASTLQWTTAFLKYIKEIFGDSLKIEFMNTFCGKTGKRIKLTEVDDRFSSQRETVNPPCFVPADHS
ncbi:hypothetical protein AAFF_G00142170 [Aldrovandia affinis]|uniref:BHLH domain-containing protein n=1 Tax=Aldrovandia affinis TaxID=143900 RepID=A0AAD7T042_9TELE|nr:hypothetical protein AAFF_G00142170 [Aldrovandia affinis]